MTIGDGVMTAAASGNTTAKHAMLKSSHVMYAQSCRDQHSLTVLEQAEPAFPDLNSAAFCLHAALLLLASTLDRAHRLICRTSKRPGQRQAHGLQELCLPLDAACLYVCSCSG